LVVRHQDVRLTWGQLKQECDRFARGLSAVGLEKGDRIGIWSPNCVEWVIAQFATPRIGAILVNINSANRSTELEYALRQSGCSALIIAPPLKTSNYAEILAEVEVPELRTVAFGDQTVPGALSWDAVLRMADGVPDAKLRAREREQHFEDPVNIQYTFVGRGIGERGAFLDRAVTAARAGHEGEGVDQRGLATRSVTDKGHVPDSVRAVNLHGRLLWARDSRSWPPIEHLSNGGPWSGTCGLSPSLRA